MEEFQILEKLLPSMAEVMNAVPGEEFRMKDSETLLILQRRLEECDLKQALLGFNEIFAETGGCTVEGISRATLSYIRVRILTENKKKNLTPALCRELQKEYQDQMTKVGNIIRLSVMNAMAADEFQKEQINLTLEKNKAFRDALRMAETALENKMKRLPPEEEEVKDAGISRENVKEDARPDHPEAEHELKEKAKKERKSPFQAFARKVSAPGERKKLEEELKEAEKEESTTRCREIPYYEKKLLYTEVIGCKDIPSYSLLKKKNNVYFGHTENIKPSFYDNEDQSLVELTEATEEFILFMSRDMLKGREKLPVFSEKERDGLKMYFDFVSGCFRKNIGVTLSVQEYLNFKSYYNRLVLNMLEQKKRDKAAYYRALELADSYLFYMDVYGISGSDDRESLAENIMKRDIELLTAGIDKITELHMVDPDAKKSLHRLRSEICSFGEPEVPVPGQEEKEPSKSAVLEYVKEVQERREQPFHEACGMQPQKSGIGKAVQGQSHDAREAQIVVQILDREHEVVDEALYAGSNMEQALYDYETRPGFMKRIGFRNNGQDVFFKEDKEAKE